MVLKKARTTIKSTTNKCQPNSAAFQILENMNIIFFITLLCYFVRQDKYRNPCYSCNFCDNFLSASILR